ncbi:Glycosyltransferase [Rhynchospora pubera]|uniref:Glycosyltransferase n=1 Tax=Rhynchospora pubera TaxID=906938 RepID=A0AAV8FTM8_9POAL|nr:Glycosyltransferase [Rhynchospora pubera]
MNTTKSHAVFLPYPAQGHITPLLKLAKLLYHSKGFHITFINTEFNHKRLLRSRGPESVRGLPDFCFETIPDGLSESDQDATQDIPALCEATRRTCPGKLKELILRIEKEEGVPPVTCIVADGAMGFAVYPAQELGLPAFLFFTTSACGFLGYLHYAQLVEKGYTPFKDESFFTDEYLNTPLDWVVGMKNARLRDMPTFIQTTDPDDIMVNINIKQCEDDAPRATGIILNTFNDLEHEALQAILSRLPNTYTVGPISPLVRCIPKSDPIASIGSNLWKEDTGCMEWFDKQAAASVVYVNYGSITTMTAEQLLEFAWGLAFSSYPFFWVLRGDLVQGSGAVLPKEYLEEIEGRGVIVGWCNQEDVLAHPAIGGYLSHCGWNSTIESIYEGVPMICWPFFAEQTTNCKYLCNEWGMGIEIGGNVKRGEVEAVVRELMEGEKGKEMRQKAGEWKVKARAAINVGGSSYRNLDKLVEEMNQFKRN